MKMKIHKTIMTLVTLSFAAPSSLWAANALAETDQLKHDVVNKEKPASYKRAHSKAGGPKTYVKPGAPVRLANLDGYTLSTGVPLSVDLELQLGSGVTRVSLAPSKALTLLSDNSFEFVDQSAVTIPLEVLTDAAELAHIHLFIEHKAPTGRETARALAVVFDSRASDDVRRAKTKPAPDVMVMPAQETIR